MKILVTGANGFIGRNLVRSLTAWPDVQVYALSRNPAVTRYGVPLGCDIADGEGIDVLFARHRFDTVVHLAAITAHEEIVGNKFKTFATNLRGTANLLDSFNRHCQGSLFIYASTGKVYGRTDQLPITECAAVRPLNILGKSKRITEEVIDFYASPANRYLVCRIFNIYGEGQKRGFVVPTIIDQLNRPVLRLGNLTDRRDYLYIGDLVEALQSCIRSADSFAPADCVNIGSGCSASVSDILHCFEQLLRRKLQVESDTGLYRQDETSVEYCSHAKLSRLTGWQPRHTLLEGLRATLQGEGVELPCKL